MCGGVGLLVPAEQWHIESACVGAAGVLSFRHRAAGYRATEGEAVKPPCAWGNEASGTCGRAEFRTCLCRRVGFQCVSGSGVAGHGAAGNCRMMECGASVCAGKQGFPGQSEVGHGASRNGGAGNVYLPTILFCPHSLLLLCRFKKELCFSLLWNLVCALWGLQFPLSSGLYCSRTQGISAICHLAAVVPPLVLHESKSYRMLHSS
jgi:hypothetical protein